jgi:site-specific DNA-methyltransferase (adenine-specific)
MEPYFSSGPVTIYCGDSRDIIPNLEIYDLLVTDPPYCNGYQSNSREVLGQFDKIVGDDDVVMVCDVLYKSWRGLKINRHGYVFGPITPTVAIPNEVGGVAELIWNKSSMSAGDLSSPWGSSHEPIWFGVKRYTGKRSERTGQLAARLRRGSVLTVSRAGEVSRSHPTQKPVELLIQLIEMSSNRGDIVFDPFAGGGSTCVAAILAGRRAIGIELDERYCEGMVIRVKEALKILKLIEKVK